jgi:hypothetical protein
VIESSADFSADGRYRYRLGRRWGRGSVVRFVMLNPSTAGAEADDPTVRRCVGLARSWGYAAIEVLNLYAFCATRPDDLARAADPVGPDNDSYLRHGVSRWTPKLIIAAWGVHARPERAAEVLGLLAGRRIHCLGRTRDGHPRHPLYVPAATRPRVFRSIRQSGA